MVWELRRYLPESLAIAHALPLFMSTFVEDRPLDAAENEAVQIEFYAMLLHFIDRRRCTEGKTPLAELHYFTKNDAVAAQWAAAERDSGVSRTLDRGHPCLTWSDLHTRWQTWSLAG